MVRREIRALTGVRGVAALLVAVYHCTMPSAMPLSYTPDCVLHGYLAVDLFFVLSGFVLAFTYGRLFHDIVTAKATGDFLLKRIARIYPAYFVISIVVVIRYSHRESMHDNHLLIANLFLIQAWGFGFRSILGNAWSVSTEVVAYLFFPWIILSLARIRAAKPLLLILAIGGILSVARFGHGVNGPLDVVPISGVFAVIRCLSGFIFGVLAFDLTRNEKVLQLLSQKIVNNVALCVIALLIALVHHDLVLFFSFPALVLILYVNQYWGKALFGNRAIFYVGTISYSLYLVHPFAQGFVSAHVAKLAYHSGIANTIGIIATLTLSCLLATVSYYLIEHPGRRFLASALRLRSVVAAKPA